MNPCSPQELKAKLDRGEDFLLLDVRTEEEIAIASLPHSTHIRLDELEARLGELAGWKSKEVVAMCHHGVRSQMAQRFLASQGFTLVRNLTGGIDAYSAIADSKVPRY
ncbi:MAG TPA: rhodanese-like domain-containing protein [Candidatus Hydrogenedentes bacterium]|nr:rhodanese-like domain-containing protein [Candidatus Hydrogenedentota bacterium]HRK36564.1 rhodanese-like domain-containing protein [Candidatus Hydrogenedentota bacterium]